MYQTKLSSTAEGIESNSRCFRALLDFGDFQIIDVGQIKLSKGSVQGDMPCIGDVVSAQGEAQVVTIPDGYTINKGAEFKLYFYLVDLYNSNAEHSWNDLSNYTWNDLADYTWNSINDLKELIPIGKFTVLACKFKSDYYTVTFTDRLSFADKTYTPNLSFESGWERSDNVMADIANQIGMTAETSSEGGYLCDKDGNRIASNDDYYILTSPFQFYMQRPQGYTMREIIGFVAAMRGKFAVADRDGTLIQRWYSDSSEALNTADEKRYIDKLEINEDFIIANGLKCNISDDVMLISGADTDTAMEFTCPFMTKQRLYALYKSAPVLYYPATFTQVLGDPRLELWDRFYQEQKELLMLNMDYTFDGGLMIDVESGGSND